MRLKKENWFVTALKPVSLALLLLFVFGIVWLRSSVVSLEYSLSTLETKRSELMRDRKLLVAEQANLLYIGRIQSVASNGSGLGFPDRTKVVYVRASGEPDTYRASLAIGDNTGQEER